MEKIIILGLLAITLFILIIKIKTIFTKDKMPGCSCASCKRCSRAHACAIKNEEPDHITAGKVKVRKEV